LVQRLHQAGVAVVALDALFAEPDRTSPKAMVDTWQLAGEQRAQLLALPDHDQMLVQVLAQGPTVLGQSLQRGSGVGEAARVKARFVTLGEAPQPFLHTFSSALNPLPALADAAQGLGAMTFVPDNDGVVRRVPLVVRVGDALVPTLSTEALRVAQGASNLVIQSAPQGGAGVTGLRVGTLNLSTTAQAEVWLHYAAHRSERSIPAWKILAGDVDASELAGKIVLVGSSSHGLMDLRFSALGQVVPGVEIQAQVIEQALSGGALRYPSWAPALEWVIACVGALLAGYLALGTSAMRSLAALLVVVAAIGLGGWLAFSQQGLLVDVVVPLLTVALSYLLCSAARHLVTEKRQHWVREVFSRYVSPNLVNYLMRQPGALELGGKRQDCSFIFTDLTGFTAMIEDMDAAAAVKLVNDYLEGMVAVVFAHQGTLTRIVGDGLVVMFSAPVVQPDHRARALRCAWDLHLFSERYVADLAARGTRFGTTRIGIHSGEVIVGNFGGKTIFDYRAHGDPVNTAARLESANKYFGTLMCVSQQTLSGCADWPVRPIGRVRLKGKQHWLEIFEPLAPDAKPDMEYLNAMQLLRQGQVHAALAAFETLAHRRGHDPLVTLHLKRLRDGCTDDAMTLSEK